MYNFDIIESYLSAFKNVSVLETQTRAHACAHTHTDQTTC